MNMKDIGKSTIAETKHFLKLITSGDKKTRSFAWKNAGKTGAPAVKALAALITNENIEVAWAAKRALREMAYYTGRPFGVAHAKEDVISELCALLGDDQPVAVRREVLWVLAEIGGDEAVEPVARLLSNRELREDARMVLDHIPGPKSLQALKSALKSVPDDFKPHIAQSLRHRGVKVQGFPCRKLVPTKKTDIEGLKKLKAKI